MCARKRKGRLLTGKTQGKRTPSIIGQTNWTDYKMRVLRKEKIGRNDPCPCGSGDKYKKSCLDDDQTVALLPSSINDWEEGC